MPVHDIPDVNLQHSDANLRHSDVNLRYPDADLRMSDAFSRMSDAFSRMSDAYLLMSDAFSRMSDAYLLMSDACSRMSGAYLLMSDAFSRMSDAYLLMSDACSRMSDAYSRMSDVYLRMSHLIFQVKRLLLSIFYLKTVEPTTICSKEEDKSRLGATHRNITTIRCLYFGALHLLRGLIWSIYYNYQRCSAPVKANHECDDWPVLFFSTGYYIRSMYQLNCFSSLLVSRMVVMIFFKCMKAVSLFTT